MKEKKIHLIIGTLICAATFLLFLAFNSKLPDNVPVQIGVDGGVSNTIPKALLTFGMPLLFVFVNLIKNTPRLSKEDESIVKLYIIPAISVIVSVLTIIFALSLV